MGLFDHGPCRFGVGCKRVGTDDYHGGRLVGAVPGVHQSSGHFADEIHPLSELTAGGAEVLFEFFDRGATDNLADIRRWRIGNPRE